MDLSKLKKETGSTSKDAILNAGYYHIKSSDIDYQNGTAELGYEPDTAYLIPSIYENIPSLKNCPVVDDKNTGQSYILYRSRSGDLPLTFNWENSAAAIKRLSFAPTKTETATLKYGLERFGDQIAKVSIMVDDLGLPSGINKHLDRLLPESYQQLLTDHELSGPLMISERVSRNRGVQLSKARKKNENSGEIILIEDQKLLTSDFIRTHTIGQIACNGLVGSVGLTKFNKDDTHQVPSCGVILAGGLTEIIKAGCTQPIINVYNLLDDPDIGRKLFDGAVIAAWLEPDLDISVTSVLLSGGTIRPVQEYSRNNWTLSQIRGQIGPVSNVRE